MGTRARQTAASPAKRTQEEESELWRALELGLSEILPELEVLDRELVFDEGGRADLAVVDGSGRLTLVLLAEDLDRTPLDVLDTLSFVRRHASLFSHHYRRKIQPELEPHVLVVSPSGDERLTLRLKPLLGHGLELYGVRTLSSRSGERSYLVPLVPTQTAAEQPGAHGEEAFLEALPRDLYSFGSTILERVGRLDDELELTANRDSLVWRFRGEILVRVERAGDTLRSSVSPHTDRNLLDGEGALEVLLEAALARLVSFLGGNESHANGPRTQRGDPPLRAVREEDPPSPRALLEEEGPLLTPEEIEAFRD